MFCPIDIPEGFSERNNCTVVALSLTTGMTYADAHSMMARAGRITGHVFSTRQFFKCNRVPGYRVYEVQGAKTLGQLKGLPGRYIARIRSSVRGKFHVVAVIDGVEYDWYANGDRRQILRLWKLEAL
jgi:hypothetical protein